MLPPGHPSVVCFHQVRFASIRTTENLSFSTTPVRPSAPCDFAGADDRGNQWISCRRPCAAATVVGGGRMWRCRGALGAKSHGSHHVLGRRRRQVFGQVAVCVTHQWRFRYRVGGLSTKGTTRKENKQLTQQQNAASRNLSKRWQIFKTNCTEVASSRKHQILQRACSERFSNQHFCTRLAKALCIVVLEQ